MRVGGGVGETQGERGSCHSGREQYGKGRGRVGREGVLEGNKAKADELEYAALNRGRGDQIKTDI